MTKYCFPVATAITVATLLATGPAAAQDAAAFYKGKTIEVLISYGAGGGYDIYGRLAARHIGAHVPGQPTVVVRNMPGAGGLNGANHLYNVAARDGTVMGVINQNAALGQALDTKGIKYDVRKFTWIGRVTSSVEVFHTWHTAGARSIQDAFTRELIAGGTGPTSSSVVMPRVMNQLLGTKFKVVSGYKGASDVALAMERGEVHGAVRPWAVLKTQSADWMRDKKIDLLVQFALERHPDLPKVPTAADLAKTEEAKKILLLLASGSSMGRSLVAPPELPADRVKTLRAAFDATMKDPKLRDEAAKAKLELDTMPGDKLATVAASVFDAPPAVIERAATLTARPKKKSKKQN
jgi:tripartite-type tricarboxylate transporter receptor subunit TctC